METEHRVIIKHKTGRDAFFPYEEGDPLETVFDGRIVLEGPLDRTLHSWFHMVAEDVFAACNDHPHPHWIDFANGYYMAGNRSLSLGDVIVIGEVALAVERIGFKEVALS